MLFFFSYIYIHKKLSYFYMQVFFFAFTKHLRTWIWQNEGWLRSPKNLLHLLEFSYPCLYKIFKFLILSSSLSQINVITYSIYLITNALFYIVFLYVKSTIEFNMFFFSFSVCLCFISFFLKINLYVEQQAKFKCNICSIRKCC